MYQVEYFNLDAIISIGYRINSRKGIQFRIWASHVLKQYLVQGYAFMVKAIIYLINGNNP
ncbi:RhuM family protein [Nitrosomonas sp.]|uniref:RhuM family protein n=1 Tax=Nitrosomonas sp. TaxID=42353 RepID=UPI0035216E8A